MLTLGDINELFPTTMDGDLYSDFFKDVYGYRPRNITFIDVVDFNNKWKELVEEHEAEMERYRLDQKIAIEKFDIKVEQTIALGTVDRPTAIKWIQTAEDAQDLDELEYIFGLPYGYLRS